MSENWLRILPAAPSFRSTERAASLLAQQVRRLAPRAESIETRDEDEIRFLDAGSNFESITCPGCGSAITLDWWSERMSEAHVDRFADLVIVTPCCGSQVSLNDLTYEWPQGFARWWLEARSPGRGELTSDEVASLAAVLGHAVRIVWTHI
jgi:hypothetical protein